MIVSPTCSRLLVSWRSGCRSSRTPSTSSTIGTTRASRPRVPAITVWVTCPTVPGSRHHSLAATRKPSATRNSPTPSRRWTSSRSSTWVPIRLAVPPTSRASPIQTAATARTGHGGPTRRGRVARPRGELREIGRRAAALARVPVPERVVEPDRVPPPVRGALPERPPAPRPAPEARPPPGGVVRVAMMARVGEAPHRGPPDAPDPAAGRLGIVDRSGRIGRFARSGWTWRGDEPSPELDEPVTRAGRAVPRSGPPPRRCS